MIIFVREIVFVNLNNLLRYWRSEMASNKHTTACCMNLTCALHIYFSISSKFILTHASSNTKYTTLYTFVAVFYSFRDRVDNHQISPLRELLSVALGQVQSVYYFVIPFALLWLSPLESIFRIMELNTFLDGQYLSTYKTLCMRLRMLNSFDDHSMWRNRIRKSQISSAIQDVKNGSYC